MLILAVIVLILFAIATTGLLMLILINVIRATEFLEEILEAVRKH